VYSPQENSSTVAEAVPSGASPSSHHNIELRAPALLLRFPPLAFLLNSFLSQINYLRECPIVTIEQPAIDLLFTVFADVCSYIVEKKADIQRLGAKYFTEGVLKDLPQSTGHLRRRKGDTFDRAAADNGESSMDQLYGCAVALELMPHVLFCFDTIFNPNAVKVESRMKLLESRTFQKSSGTASLQYLVRNLWEARDFLDADVADQLEGVWSGLVRAGLVDGSVLRKEAPALLTVAPPRERLDPSELPSIATVPPDVSPTDQPSATVNADSCALIDSDDDII